MAFDVMTEILINPSTSKASLILKLAVAVLSKGQTQTKPLVHLEKLKINKFSGISLS